MNRVVPFLCLLALALPLAAATGFCWTSAAYHVAAQALAVGVGTPSSASVCIYGNNTRLNYDCPLSCQALITATWGDCYCREPNYHPYASGADPFIGPLTTYQIFRVLATSAYTSGANCRYWMQGRNDSWMCK